MQQNGWRLFLSLCTHIKDETLLTELFDLLLTSEEIASLETRCLIIQELLKKKKPQRQISYDLNVSIAKITRGSNELKRISPRLSQFLSDYFHTTNGRKK